MKNLYFLIITSLFFAGIGIVFSHNLKPVVDEHRIDGVSPMYYMRDYDSHKPMRANGTIYTWHTGKMRWYAYGYVECKDESYKSTYWIDTSIYRSGKGIVDEDLSPRDKPSDYTKYGVFWDSRESSYNEILPRGASDNPRDYINDCYSFTFIGGLP